MKGFSWLASFWLFVSVASAQTVPATYPKNVDLGVNGITLNFRKSSEDVLGAQLVLSALDKRREIVRCLNKEGTEELTLTHFVDRGKNSFQHFRVRKVGAKESLSDIQCKLDSVVSFESFRGVRLGMSVGELTQILGDRFGVEAKGAANVLVYSVDTNMFSGFLQHYGELGYTGRYTFRNGSLISFEFGFN